MAVSEHRAKLLAEINRLTAEHKQALLEEAEFKPGETIIYRESTLGLILDVGHCADGRLYYDVQQLRKDGKRHQHRSEDRVFPGPRWDGDTLGDNIRRPPQPK